MSGSSRKRSSKWDLREEFESKQLRPSWSSRDGQRNNSSKWSYLEEAHKDSSGNDIELSSKENYHGSRGSRKDDIINKDSRRNADASMTWERDSSYGTRMSPGLEEWKHRSRSRSPQNIWHSVRSRSRSRSRSPERGYRKDIGVRDRTRSRSGASAQTCRDFVAGNCRRGSHCHFLHDGDKNYDDNRETRYKSDGASRHAALDESEDYLVRSGKFNDLCPNFARGKCRMGASCRYVHHGIPDGLSQGVADELGRERELDRRNRENSFERVRQEPGRSTDTPCKFFAAGHCRNGKYCRFSHDDQAFASPKGRSKDERRGHNRNEGEHAWDRSRQSDTTSPNGGSRDEKREVGHSIVDVNKVWNGPRWDDVDTSKTVDPPKPGSTSWPVSDRWDHKLEDNTKFHEEHATESGKKEGNPWETQTAGARMNHPEARGADKWIGDVDMSPDWHYRLESSNFVAKEVPAQSRSSLPGNETGVASHEKDRTKSLPGEGLNENRQLHAPGVHLVGRSQATVPDIPSSGNYLEGLHGKSGFADDQGSTRPNVGKASPLQVNSTIPPTQITVSSDQLSHLTNLSASLVHLLGTGQQLPQLYATLNSHNSKTAASFGNTEGPFEPASLNTIKPDRTIDHTIEIQQQQDPICNRIETKNTDDASVMPSTSTPNSVGQKGVLAEKLERRSLASIPDKAGDAHHVGNSDERKAGKIEQSVEYCEATAEKNLAMADGSKTVKDGYKKTKENVKLENTEGDGGTDEDKKTKDGKVIRAFKFALVEFVKEILKSTWKEGKITKEDYKTIVKKVVDKVTGSLQANHIPQTQEKIDQYLSYSKAKLTKLVQAYVEKVQKA